MSEFWNRGTDRVLLNCIVEWPGTPGLKVPKTPTLIDYSGGSGGKSFLWGSKVNPVSKGKLEGIKLLLDPDQPVPLYVPASNARREIEKLGKPVVDVASDYLKALYEHAMGYITAAYPRDFVDMQQKKFVLTVPAVWSDKAKDLTLRVCSKNSSAIRVRAETLARPRRMQEYIQFSSSKSPKQPPYTLFITSKVELSRYVGRIMM